MVKTISVGLDELTRRQQRSSVEVARVLAQRGRFTVFEATANIDIARTIDRLQRKDWFTFDHSVGYPWTRCALNEVGRRALKEAP